MENQKKYSSQYQAPSRPDYYSTPKKYEDEETGAVVYVSFSCDLEDCKKSIKFSDDNLKIYIDWNGILYNESFPISSIQGSYIVLESVIDWTVNNNHFIQSHTSSLKKIDENN